MVTAPVKEHVTGVTGYFDGLRRLHYSGLVTPFPVEGVPNVRTT
jgi:hypothetical protein